jgi:hypothetical protein
MPLDGHLKVIKGDAGAIVSHSDFRATTVDERHINPSRSGVKCVLNQLFNDRGRTLDDLAGGNLSNGFVCETLNGHGVASSSIQLGDESPRYVDATGDPYARRGINGHRFSVVAHVKTWTATELTVVGECDVQETTHPAWTQYRFFRGM